MQVDIMSSVAYQKRIECDAIPMTNEATKLADAYDLSITGAWPLSFSLVSESAGRRKANHARHDTSKVRCFGRSKFGVSIGRKSIQYATLTTPQ